MFDFQEAVKPSKFQLMHTLDSTSTPREIKRKRDVDELDDETGEEITMKKTRLNHDQEDVDNPLAPEASLAQPSTSAVEEIDALGSVLESASAKKLPRRFVEKTIPRDDELPKEVMHPKKLVELGLEIANYFRGFEISSEILRVLKVPEFFVDVSFLKIF